MRVLVCVGPLLVHEVRLPLTTALERRDCALLALAALTGARVRALTSFHHGHINLREGYVEQDARTVQTKFAKTFRTYFLPVGDEALTIFSEWHRELERDHLWGSADPLFPATEIELGSEGGFSALGGAVRLRRTFLRLAERCL